MSALEAARIGDQIGHTCAMSGRLTGLVGGLIVAAVVVVSVAATIATAGAAAVLIGGVIAGVAGAGLAGMNIGATIDSDPKGPISSGSPNTFLGTGMRAAARAVVDTVACMDHSVKLIAQGSLDVYINNQPAARRTDGTVCSALIREGQPDVFFGGPTGTYLDMESEVPGWLVTTLEWAMWIGAAVATGGAWATVGFGAAVGGLLGSLGGGWVGAKIGGAIGGLFGRTGQAIGEAVGGFAGSIFGGGLGARVGNDSLARLPGSTSAQVTARMNVARDYISNSPDYQPRSGSAADIAAARARVSDQMSGIDFNQPVRVRTIQENTVYDQLQNRGASGPGNFIAKPGTTASEIGLGSSGRDYATGEVGPKQLASYEVPAGTRVLESTAAPKDDFWSVGSSKAPGGGYYDPVIQPSSGGGQQTLIGSKGDLVPVSPPANASPNLLDPGTPTTFTPGNVVPNQVVTPSAGVAGGTANYGTTGTAIGVGVGPGAGSGPDPAPHP
jgi:uncharacterized Zn-binding protein involved in type VI secretion